MGFRPPPQVVPAQARARYKRAPGYTGGLGTRYWHRRGAKGRAELAPPGSGQSGRGQRLTLKLLGIYTFTLYKLRAW